MSDFQKKSGQVRESAHQDLSTIHIRASLKTQYGSDRGPNGGYAVSICGGPPKKFQSFISIFERMRSTFVFWAV